MVDNVYNVDCVSHLLGDVQAQSVHDVSEEEQVDLAFAIPVVDVADVLNLSLVNLKENENKNLVSQSFKKNEKEEITELLICSTE